jgi:hypothetical protein
MQHVICLEHSFIIIISGGARILTRGVKILYFIFIYFYERKKKVKQKLIKNIIKK